MSDPTRAMLLTYNGSGWGMTLPDGVLYTGSSAAKFDIIFDDPSGGTPDLLLRGQSGLIGTVDADNDYVFYVQVSTTTVGIDQGYNLFMGGGQIFASTGDATAPAYAFDTAHDLGVYAASGTSIGVTCSGANVATFTTTGLQLATVLAGAYGGTGVANTGKTITVSGNTTIGSSTHTVAFATGANTSVTLPSSGTLATLAGTEALTNKTINGSNNTITNVSLTSGVTGTLPVANGGTAFTAAPKVIAYPSTNQTLTAGGTTDTVAFGTEVVDTDNAFASNTFTVPSNQGGYYAISLSSLFMQSGGSAAGINVSVAVNGSNVHRIYQQPISAGAEWGVGGYAMISVAAGDAVTITITQSDGAAWTILGGVSTIGRLTIHRVI